MTALTTLATLEAEKDQLLLNDKRKEALLKDLTRQLRQNSQATLTTVLLIHTRGLLLNLYTCSMLLIFFAYLCIYFFGLLYRGLIR